MNRCVRTAVCLSAVLVLLSACTSRSTAPMEAGTPPGGWEQSVLDTRAAMDIDFRTAADSPIPPADRESFTGLEYWPPDPAYRFVGPIRFHENPEKFTIITTTGRERPCERYGWIEFELHGTSCTLQIYRMLDNRPESGEPSMFLPFRDGTSGKETYPAGRYVDITQSEDGRFVVDFNRAYNPFCAYGSPERYACPVTPTENRLKVRIEAGERGFKRIVAGGAAR